MKSTTPKKKATGRAKFILYGFILWTLWVIFYAIFFKFQVGVPWGVAFLTSAENYYIFALLSVGIWFVCRQIPYGRLPVPIFVFIHFILSMLCSALWMFLTYGLWYLHVEEEIFRIINMREIVGWQFLFGMITYLLIAGVFYTIIYYRHFREKELREAELLYLTKEVELKALKSQINPHFFFNTLNSIYALIDKNPSGAKEMLTKLSDILRYTLDGFNQHFIPFELELQFIRTYIEIEKVRLGDRLNVRIDVDHEVLQQQVPSMFLQPLVENAIVHGIAKRAEGGRVHICGCCEDTTLSFEVRDSGRGIPPRELERVFDRGLGLANTQKRLERIYGDQFQMSIRNIEPRGLSVQLKFPQKAS